MRVLGFSASSVRILRDLRAIRRFYPGQRDLLWHTLSGARLQSADHARFGQPPGAQHISCQSSPTTSLLSRNHPPPNEAVPKTVPKQTKIASSPLKLLYFVVGSYTHWGSSALNLSGTTQARPSVALVFRIWVSIHSLCSPSPVRTASERRGVLGLAVERAWSTNTVSF